MTFEESIFRVIRKYHMIEPGSRTVCALSGGADSVCLLFLLLSYQAMMPFSLSAVHVHHGIRKEADQDEMFVRRLCERLEIELTVFHVDVPGEVQKTHESLETAARRMRYAQFETLGADRIALAHHQRDQAETVLMNLIRGAGSDGLSGMAFVRGRYIRPLLDADPEAIRVYLKEKDLTWVEDASNGDTHYRRNFIRHEVMPLLQTLNPQIVGTLARTACLMRDEGDLLKELTEKAYAEAASSDGGLSVEILKTIPSALQRRVIREYLLRHGGLNEVSVVHVDALMHLMNAPSGTRAEVSGGRTFVKEYDWIRPFLTDPFLPEMKPEPFFLPKEAWHGRIDGFDLYADVSIVKNVKIDTFSENQCTKYFDYDTIGNTLTIRTLEPGDYLTMAGGHKTLKKYMSDEKIPSHLRARIPLLADGKHILWVIGRRMSDACKVRPDTERIIRVSLYPDGQKEEQHD